MIVLTYYEAYKNMKNFFNIRYNMVQFALEHSISEAARKFRTTRTTVRKWVRRFEQYGVNGLVDLSKAPKNPYRKTSKETEELIIRIRKQFPYKGAYRIRTEHGVNCSDATIARILKRNGLVKKTKKKYQMKRDLRKVKQKLRNFETIQIDIKHLTDIDTYFPYTVRNNYPKYQFSARDVKSGVAFVSYGYEKSATNMGIFLLLLLNHLIDNGVDLTKVSFQSDNGTEFIGSSKAVGAKSLYKKVAESFGVKTVLIPPASPTYNSDVEAFHWLIEREFYREEKDFSSLGDFLNKAFTYMSYFNIQRRFRYKNGKTPLEILLEDKSLDYKNALRLTLFYPVILDYLIFTFLFSSGYHLLRSDIC